MRIDPDILVVVSSRRSAETDPSLTSVRRLHGHDAGAVDDVGILRINLWNRQIAASDSIPSARVHGDVNPIFPGIVGTIDAKTGARSVLSAVGGCDGCIEAIGIAGRNGNIDLHEICWQAFC